jgi:hypothetical protein
VKMQQHESSTRNSELAEETLLASLVEKWTWPQRKHASRGIWHEHVWAGRRRVWQASAERCSFCPGVLVGNNDCHCYNVDGRWMLNTVDGRWRCTHICCGTMRVCGQEVLQMCICENGNDLTTLL